MNNPRDTSQDALFSMIKTVVRHSVVYGFFDMLARISSLVLLPLYTHVLSAADFGTLEIFVVSQGLLLIVLVLGFNSALVRFYTTAPEGEDRRRYFRTAFTGVVLVAGVLGVILIAAAPIFSNLFFGDASRTMHWRVLFATVILDAAGAMFLALFRSQERPVRYSLINLGRFMVILVLNVILVGVLEMGVKGALLGNFIGACVGTLFGLVLAGREFGIGISGARLGRLAKFGLPLVVHGVALTLMMASAAYFLKGYGTLTDVGIYRVGQKVAMAMSVITTAFTVAWLPVQFRIFRAEGAQAIYSRVITYYLFVTCGVLVVVSSYSYEIVRLISAPEFEQAGSIVLLILASYLVQGLHYLATTGITLTDRTQWVSLVAGVSVLGNLGINFLLIPSYGMMGAAWASLLSFIFLAVFMKVVADRFYVIPIEGRRVMILLIAVGLVLGINGILIGHGSASAALAKIVPLVMFPMVLAGAGFFTSEERIRVLGLIQRR